MAHPTGFRPVQPRLIQVKRITDLSPHLRCITFHSDTLHDYPADGRHAAHIKLFLARPGQKAPTLPTVGERGPQWPEGEERPVVRTYTLYAFRPELGEVDVAFALHDHGGPAVTFACNAQPGDSVGITQPGGPHPMLPASSAYYLAGDPSSLPAIAALLGALPPDATGHAVIRIDSEADRLPMTAPNGLSVHWVVGSTASTDTLLQQFHAVTRDIDASRAFFWLAGEDRIVVQLRRYVRRELKAERNQLYAVPYWREGLNEEDYHQKRHDVMDNPDD